MSVFALSSEGEVATLGGKSWQVVVEKIEGQEVTQKGVVEGLGLFEAIDMANLLRSLYPVGWVQTAQDEMYDPRTGEFIVVYLSCQEGAV